MTIETIVESGMTSLRRFGRDALVYGMILSAGMNLTGCYNRSIVSSAEAKPKPTITTTAKNPGLPPKTSKKKQRQIKKTRYRQNLKNLVLVLDPGHGEEFDNLRYDPGACRRVVNRTGKKTLFTEAQFTWDIAMRLKYEVESRGGQVQLTLVDPENNYGVSNNHIGLNLPTVSRKVYRASSRVDGELDALQKRCDIANHYLEKFRNDPNTLVRFISVHYDSRTPDGPDYVIDRRGKYVRGSEQDSLLYKIRGPCIMTHQGVQHSLADAIRDVFESDGRYRYSVKSKIAMKNGKPIIVKGKKKRISYVGRTNMIERPGNSSGTFRVLNPLRIHVPEPILIETSHIRNDQDFYRLRDPKVRQEYAELIAKGLVTYMHRLGK